jgi:hypothetical protein
MFLPLLLLLPTVLGNVTASPVSTVCNQQAPPEKCPTDAECSVLGTECLQCSCPTDCLYGRSVEANCVVHPDISCNGERNFTKMFECRFCYQTDPKLHKCKDNFDCQSTGDPNKLFYRANCSVPDDVLCLGRRQFMKQKKCNWTGGYKWSTAMALSITLGGFGADRSVGAKPSCGLCYKTITIVSDATIWSLTYDQLMTLAKARIS